jgi:fatty-acyl-CoA synthase
MAVFTYRQFDDEVNRAVGTLGSLGVSKGDRVSLLLTNRAEYLIFYFACFKMGAWAGPVNALLKPQEIEFIIANAGAATVVTQPDLLPHLDVALGHVKALRYVIVIEDSGVVGVRRTPAGSRIRRWG